MNLYAHQTIGVNFLGSHKSALLADEMGLGKSRQVLVAAQGLFAAKKIDRLIVLAPAAVRLSWRQEIDKLEAEGLVFMPCIYDPNKQIMYGAKSHLASTILPVAILSYSLLPQKRHVEALTKWCTDGRTLFVCDESSFLANRASRQTKRAMSIGARCAYRWLLTGTPIANSPLDLWGQGLVMAGKKSGKYIVPSGPLHGFVNFTHFQATYAIVKMMRFGGPGTRPFRQEVGYQRIDELTKRFAPYVLRRTKEECLDLPEKTYTQREVALSTETWKIYCELKKEAMLCLPDSEAKPEPNAAVRILRLCQLTSGHVGGIAMPDGGIFETPFEMPPQQTDVSSEKLSWLAEQILEGELSSESALIVWCRWRRERERLAELISKQNTKTRRDTMVLQIYGGQSQKERDFDVQNFQELNVCRRILLAQPHAGGFGLTLTAASTAIYLSNDFSYTTRVQSEDRQHRIGQTKPCLYIDVLAVSPTGGKTIDHHVLECLRNKKSVADLTCSAWRKILA